MKSRKPKGSGVYAYLDACGVLDGSDAEIQAARKRYWAARKKDLAKEKRLHEHPFTIWLTGIENEAMVEAAKALKCSRTRYIKQAAVHAVSGKQLIPDAALLAEFNRLLNLVYARIDAITEKLPEEAGLALIGQMEYLESEMLRLAAQAACRPCL